MAPRPSQRMLERLIEMFAKVLELHLAPKRPSVNGTYFMSALVLRELLNMAKFPSSKLRGKPVQVMENKMNPQLTRITGYEDR